VIVYLGQEEADELGNMADLAMEQWVEIRAEAVFGTPIWRRAHEQVEFWTHLAVRLGCRYENVTIGEKVRVTDATDL
jgi:hypothetical protein